jgi:hypothetical protein
MEWAREGEVSACVSGQTDDYGLDVCWLGELIYDQKTAPADIAHSLKAAIGG